MAEGLGEGLTFCSTVTTKGRGVLVTLSERLSGLLRLAGARRVKRKTWLIRRSPA